MLLVFVSCRDKHEQLAYSDNDVITDILLPFTPVKDQGRTELCWLYAMLATIETDRIAMGDSVHLSPMWLERKSLEEQAVACYLTGSDVSLRGTLPEAMRLFDRYGIIAYDAYRPGSSSFVDSASSSAIARKAQHIARTMAAQRRGVDRMNAALADMLDHDLGPAPRYVFMLGMEYTAKEFGHSCAMPGDWHAYTSFSHHPYGEPFCIEVPDNRQHHEAMNVPIDTLYDIVVSSLRHRHPVAWEGTVSPRLKPKAEGVSGLKSGDLSVQRQKAFESFSLTDDHCMAIIGIAHRKDGTPLFVCKNSWGTENGINGLRYMTREEFMLSTILVMLKQ